MSKVNLFNHSVGIQDFLLPNVQSHIPSAKPLASTAAKELAVVEHFNLENITASMEKFLAPEVGDGEVLRPDIFNKVIADFHDKYQGNEEPDVKNFLNEIIKPMLANKELLQAYTNLMISG